MDRYILINKKPVYEPDLMKWSAWFETKNRQILRDHVPGNGDISTIFLGIDHGFSGEAPLLFETMIFGGEHDGYQERYYTYEQAVKGHKKALRMVKGLDLVEAEWTDMK